MDNASKPTRPFLASTNASFPATWQTNMDQSNMSPELSLQPDAYLMHGGNAGAGAGTDQLSEVPVFPDEAVDQHIQQHYNPYSLSYGHDARTLNAIAPNAYYGAILSTPHHDHFAGFYHQPPAPTVPNLAFNTFTGPVSNTPTTSHPAPPPASKRYHCPHPGCTISIKNAADLTRHAKKHQEGPKEYGCPIRGCPRVGVMGFSRKDKLNDHLKAKHKMSRIG